MDQKDLRWRGFFTVVTQGGRRLAQCLLCPPSKPSFTLTSIYRHVRGQHTQQYADVFGPQQGEGEEQPGGDDELQEQDDLEAGAHMHDAPNNPLHPPPGSGSGSGSGSKSESSDSGSDPSQAQPKRRRQQSLDSHDQHEGPFQQPSFLHNHHHQQQQQQGSPAGSGTDGDTAGATASPTLPGPALDPVQQFYHELPSDDEANVSQSPGSDEEPFNMAAYWDAVLRDAEDAYAGDRAAAAAAAAAGAAVGGSDGDDSDSSGSCSDEEADDDPLAALLQRLQGQPSEAVDVADVPHLARAWKEPVYAGCPLTLEQYVYEKLMSKRRHNTTDAAFNEDAEYNANGGHMPQPNTYPADLRQAKKLIGASEWTEHKEVVCADPDCLGWVAPKHADGNVTATVCGRSDCQKPICVSVLRGRKTVQQPKAWYIEFRLDDVIRQFFQDPEWVSGLDSSIPKSLEELCSDDVVDNGTLWGGSDIRRIVQQHPDILHPDHGAWEVCLDWIRPFKGTQYSVGVLGIRCAKRHNMMRSKQINYKVVAVFPGPTIAKNLRPFLYKTVAAFRHYGLRSEGLEVTSLQVTANGSTVRRTFKHKPFLVGFHSDSPARQKAAGWPGVASLQACGFCSFRCQQGRSARGKLHAYPKGYHVAVLQPPQPGVPRSRGRTVRVRDQSLQLTSQQQLERGHCVQAQKGPARQQAAQQLGCVGLSVIPEILPYISYSHVWVVPVIHTLLYGVVADFVKHMLRSKGSKSAAAAAAAAAAGDEAAAQAALVGTLPAAALRTMSARAADVKPPTDYGRPYRDIVTCVNSYLMEDWLHFVETASLYIFKDVLPADVRQLWELLRGAVLHYCRPANLGAGFQAARKQAAKDMFAFAQQLEQRGYPDYLFTWNLHWAVCQLPVQEEARGSAAASAEWWTERLMQTYKNLVGGRVTHGSEQTFANTLLLDVALARMRFDNPSLGDRDGKGQKASRHTLAHNEDPGDSSQVQLQGKGQRPTRQQRMLLLPSLDSFIAANPELAVGWTPALLARALNVAAGGNSSSSEQQRRQVRTQQQHGTGAYLFLRAVTDDEQVSTDSYMRAVRPNYYVQVSFEGNTGRLTQHVAVVKYLLWLRHPDNAPWEGGVVGQQLSGEQQAELDQDLRVAVLDVYSPPSSVGGMLKVGNRNTVADALRTVHLSQLDGKLVACVPSGTAEAYFLRYGSMSRLIN